jgi:hypothetical protein
MKVQPNFSWQKYEGKPEDQRQQFQFQLQQQHITLANAINATIDDISYFTKERQTGETWINSKAIWNKTITGTIVGTADTAYPLGVDGINQMVRINGIMQNAGAFADAEPIPYLDPTALVSGVGLYVSGTDLHINAGDGTFTGYQFAVTIQYTK